MSIKEYIGKAEYNADGQMIFCGKDEQHLCDIRGWGRINKLFGFHSKAIAFQDSVGQFIADAINEKLQRVD